jgi:hypothetical protein
VTVSGRSGATTGTAITPDMIKAGVGVLESYLHNDYELVRFVRRDAVREIYAVMRAARVAERAGQLVNLTGENP